MDNLRTTRTGREAFPEHDQTFSLLILTYNRSDSVGELLAHIQQLGSAIFEIIVVDNASTDDTEITVKTICPRAIYIKADRNLGACGRNLGIEQAKGKYIITLDDDVFGISLEDLTAIRTRFEADPLLAAINFRVLDYFTKQLTNWIHRRERTEATSVFNTYEITEGAAAFRKAALKDSGLYWTRFFISHEGPDLAFRLMDRGYSLIYDGHITVLHKHESSGRPSWRFYYYDTRNLIWLAARNMRFRYGFRFLFINLSAMAYYSIRGRSFSWWIRAVIDGIIALPEVLKTRTRWSKRTESRIMDIDRNKISFRRRLHEALRKGSWKSNF
jgi:GT2 family glycosyltransferase